MSSSWDSAIAGAKKRMVPTSADAAERVFAGEVSTMPHQTSTRFIQEAWVGVK